MPYISLYFIIFLKHSVVWWFALRGQEQSSKKGSKASPNRLIHADSMPLRVPNHQVKPLDDDGWWMMDDGCWTATHAILVTVRISLILAKLKKAISSGKPLKTWLLYTSSCWPQHFPEEKPNETHLSSNRSLFFFVWRLFWPVHVGEILFFPGCLISSCCVWCQEVLRLVALGKYNCRTERQPRRFVCKQRDFGQATGDFCRVENLPMQILVDLRAGKSLIFQQDIYTLTYLWSTFQQSPCDRLPV